MPKPDLVLVAGRPRSTVPHYRSTEDVVGLYRMRRFIEPELAAESCARISPADLDRLEAHIPFFATDSEQVYAAHRAFHMELLRPAASRWDLRVLRPLWAQLDALAHSVFGSEGRTSCDVILTGCTCRSLLIGYRTGDPEAARAASLRCLEHAERFMGNVAGSVSPAGRSRPGAPPAAARALRW